MPLHLKQIDTSFRIQKMESNCTFNKNLFSATEILLTSNKLI